MKMVKCMLLGTTAGIVAVAGAQAADLPVKAKSVEYVKVCSLYGAGFYYIPGSDICLKVGGYVRAEVGYNLGNSLSNGPFGSGWNTRVSDNLYVERSRYMATFDARSQTAYGTARAYFAVGATGDWPSTVGAYNYRGFIQWAGFTFGQAASFFDFHNIGAYQYTAHLRADSADNGQRLVAYTANFGGGFSATLSLEEPRRATLYNAVGAAASIGGSFGTLLTSSAVAIRYPDIVGSLKVDQPWGSAQIMGAVVDASASYYSGGLPAGSPADKWGWAVGGGAKINASAISPGDHFSFQVTYAVGAIRYASFQAGGLNMFNYSNMTNASPVGYGVSTDGVFTDGGPIHLTTAWSAHVGYDHFWRKDLHTSLWFNYFAVDYNAAANALLAAKFGGTNYDWSIWAAGSRTQWDVSKALLVGAEVVYTSLKTSQGGLPAAIAPRTVVPVGLADQAEWSFRLRAQYSFLP